MPIAPLTIARRGIKNSTLDSTMQRPCRRLVSNDGVATAFSFRGDIDLPAPWRVGRQTSDGKKTMLVTGRDLGLDGDLAPHRS
jgi:hypothetical protein